MISKTYEDISTRDFYYKFFELYNVLQSNLKLKLTENQIRFISEFLALDASFKYTRFKIQGKRQVIENIKARDNEEISVQNLDATLSLLKKKGIIIEQSDRMRYLNPKIEKFIDPNNKSFEFRFKFNIK